ncbi:hypothetical protein D1872_257380 [compost metagenome]
METLNSSTTPHDGATTGSGSEPGFTRYKWTEPASETRKYIQPSSAHSRVLEQEGPLTSLLAVFIVFLSKGHVRHSGSPPAGSSL